MTKKQSPSNISRRVCGNCTACCKTHHVFDINKPAGQWCQHCTPGHGCNIYTERPQGCRDFICQWIKGYGEEAERPDRSGIVIDYGNIGLPESVAILWEFTEGTLESPYAKDVLHTFLSNDLMVSFAYLSGKITIIIPPSKILCEEDMQALQDAGYHIFIAKEMT